MKTIGIALLIIGITMTLFTGFTYLNKKEVVDLGSIEISKTEKHPIYWSPVVGGVITIVGLLILVIDRTNRRRNSVN
ncbi:MAG: hypothetical protein O9302_08830 [Cyclobacteriaceae bacterium]|jgi:hypothetical protein|nr:hypothetical protein [Flammeovirgaceae bacterium]MCZ8020407.1 hypothetical protein [Cytophagales bacterium]MCZ8328149.1 hypothetical protein [Cyclobacteriaceae bacterium]